MPTESEEIQKVLDEFARKRGIEPSQIPVAYSKDLIILAYQTGDKNGYERGLKEGRESRDAEIRRGKGEITK